MRGLVRCAVLAALVLVAGKAVAAPSTTWSLYRDNSIIMAELDSLINGVGKPVGPDSIVVKSNNAATDSLTIGATKDTLRVNKGTAANITNMSSTVWLNVKFWMNGGANDTIRMVVPPLTYRRFQFADLDSFTIPEAAQVIRDAEAKK